MAPPLTCPECGTFVRMDWTDYCGSCEAPLGEPDAPPRLSAPSHTGGNLLVVIVGVIVLTIIGGGVAFAVSDGDPLSRITSQVQGSVTKPAGGATSTTTTQPMSASELAKAVEPSAADVGSTWTPTGEEVISQSDISKPSACWPSDSQMSANAAGSQGFYAYNEPSHKGNNLLEYDVTVANNADIAAHQQSQVTSKSYEPCLATADNSLASALGTVKSRTITRINRTMPIAYAGYKDNIKLSTGSVVIETVFLQSGRTREKLRFSYCECSGGAAANQEAIISSVAVHLQDNQSR